MAKLGGRIKQLFTIHRIPRDDEQMKLLIELTAKTAGREGGAIADIGCGSRRMAPKTIRIDIDRAVMPDVVARVEQLPFRAGCFAGAVVTDVLMYSDDPRMASVEAMRVVQSGGHIYAAEPFLYPDVGASRWRFTQSGLRTLFRELEVIRIGCGRGPTSAILPIVTYYNAQVLSFGARRLYGAWVRVIATIMAPLVLLDELIMRWREIPMRVYTNVYLVGRKRD